MTAHFSDLVDHFRDLADAGDHDEAWRLSGDAEAPGEILAAIALAYPESHDLRRATPDECEDIRQRVFLNLKCPAETWARLADEDLALLQP